MHLVLIINSQPTKYSLGYRTKSYSFVVKIVTDEDTVSVLPPFEKHLGYEITSLQQTFPDFTRILVTHYGPSFLGTPFAI
ncbi:hypothetical protein BDQ94DRAFT_140624 [Aspergillus welwitschiae]|uniref:Uncharacterized protein n=1 Tax=Aspergillus welwitschiae TaxID=1341132 RepID=A0A3F3Q824_9EURO|nr:hypothetical protein BDQ94DRAFT_140624 [Aspergillus welwitschiae]RDH35313.1 hypothetical protein BDQ94DRAFT_140624 [Aspergillus welwitschiae]